MTASTLPAARSRKLVRVSRVSKARGSARVRFRVVSEGEVRVKVRVRVRVSV